MNILITGSNGQLGNEMRLLAENYSHHTCFFTDIDELDISNQAAVRNFVQDNRIGMIVNCAAYTAVDKAEDDKELCNLLNHVAPGYLAKAAQEHGAGMIHISTDYVFDGTNHTPYTEEDTVCPTSYYGLTKLKGEENVTENCKNSAVIRTSWLYSRFGNNFVKTMIRLGKEREKLSVVFDQIGTPTYARDLAEAIYRIIDQGIEPGIYHYSNEGVCSWYDFTINIHRISGIKSCEVSPIHTAEFPTKATRPHYSVLDKTKIKNTFGVVVPHWQHSLTECVHSLENQN